MKEIIRAPMGSLEYQQSLFTSLQQRIRRGEEESFLVLLPTSQLLHQFRDTLVTEASRQLNLLSFDELARQMETEKEAKFLAGQARLHTFGHVVKSISGSYEYLSASRLGPGMIQSLLQTVVRLRRSLVTPGALENALNTGAEDPLTRDVARVYRAYSDFLTTNSLADIEEVYFSALNRLNPGKDSWLQGIDWVILDQFFDFEPIQLALLEQISRRVERVTVCLPFFHCEPHSIVEKTAAQLEQLGFVPMDAACGSWGRPSYLTEHLFKSHASMDREKYIPVTELAGGKLDLELELVAGAIKELARSGVGPGEMCLVVPDPDKYLPRLRAQFSLHQIDISIPTTIALTGIPWVREIISIWEAAAENLDSSSLTNLVKAGYINHFLPAQGDVDAAEMLIRIHGDHAGGDWPRLLAREELRLEAMLDLCTDDWERKQVEGPVQLLKMGRPSIEAAVTALGKWFPQGGRYKYKVDRHCSLLRGLLRANLERVSPEGLDETHIRDRLACVKVVQAVSDYLECCQRFPDNRLTPAEFAGELTTWLAQTVEMERTSPGALQILTPAQGRGLSFRYLFILGMNEGVFPRPITAHWLHPRPAMQAVARALDVVLDNSPRDKLFFHNCVAMAREGLYVSRVLPGPEDEAGESVFLQELRTVAPVKTVVRSGVSPFPEMAEIINCRQLSGRLFLDLAGNRSGDLHRVALAWLQKQDWFDGVMDCAGMELSRESVLEPGKYDGMLAAARPGLVKKFSRGIYSISRLEQYIRCPYSFFARYVLALSPAPGQRQEYTPLERGGFLHWILEHFYKRHVISGSFPEDLPGVIAGIAREYMAREGWDDQREVWRLRLEEAVALLTDLISEDREWMNRSGLKPALLEATFGLPDSPVEPVSLSGGLRFQGKIDRIDVMEQNGECWACVYDYKSSGSVAAADISRGHSYQIPVYLAAAGLLLEANGYVNVRVMGGGYYILKTGKRQGGIWRDQFNTATPNRLQSLNHEEWTALTERLGLLAEEYHQRILAGEFTPAPRWERDCSWCDFAACCRFDKNRFKGKGGGIGGCKQA